ncbi:MAG: ATP-binding protein [Spirochaetota bacterium]
MNNPVTAILGPRQCGKSTLAKKIILSKRNTLYLDLELTSDLNKLHDAEAFFRMNKEKLICLDEIQRMPEIFPLLRSIVDINKRNGQFLLLGSAAPDLLRQTSETLAGRISFLELTPFLLSELKIADEIKLRSFWQRGGFPRSYLASDELNSYEWRQDFIRTFLERDIPSLGFNLEHMRLRRFWMMCAYLSGQVFNSSKIGESLGVSHHTIRSYLELFEKTFLLRVLSPFEMNIKKRLIKSPKVYLRDTGLLHALLEIRDHNQLLGHPVYGSSWESFVIEQILAMFPDWNGYFYRTSNGNEIDLILERGNKRVAIECKASSSPQISKRFYNALSDLGIDDAYVIAPVDTPYPLGKNIMVYPIRHLIVYLDQFS